MNMHCVSGKESVSLRHVLMAHIGSVGGCSHAKPQTGKGNSRKGAVETLAKHTQMSRQTVA